MAGSATIYWYEADDGEFQVKHLTTAHLRQGVDYETEVRIKYARNPVRFLVIPSARAGNSGERLALDELKAEAKSYREKLASQ